MKKFLSLIMTFAMVFGIFTIASTAVSAEDTDKVLSDDSSFEVSQNSGDFSWDNASIYFLLTDRFNNGNTSNDHSYGRGLNQSGQVVTGNSDAGAFHGGDFVGITQKIAQGYFDDLGINALWISAPYEQIHGYCNAGAGKSGSFPHYSYHGYYALDFSQSDANFGTEEEFAAMVETAHKHNIRIVLDVVMNHVGYNNMQDMYEYNYGVLKDGWETGYYNGTLTDVTYANSIDYGNNADAWCNWWGPDWLRCGLPGYVEESGVEEGCQSYLPDLKTNYENTVDIPNVLRVKWTKENTLEEKLLGIDSYFTGNEKSKTVRNYLVYWLQSWVEKYGIDGFRCDTAKHVEIESWAALKEQCKIALKNWRSNNPDKAGADWKDEFWMTGECYPHFIQYDKYYTSGAFDSMINFSFNNSQEFNANGSGVPDISTINEKYEEYAKEINTKEDFNVLSYISSHDTKLCRSNMIYQGSAFQLLPGGIQIYYGDESNRPLVGGLAKKLDHNLRADMNWDSMDENLLAHWQKVGTFRNNHISIGAGSHKTLTSTSGAAFERYYDKNDIKDKVICCIGADANTNISIAVDSADFPDGTILKNCYDNTEGMVYHGKVTFNSGANGTVLCEVSGKGTPVAVEAVKIQKDASSIYIGDTILLSALVTPDNATDSIVVWSSSDEKVATVDFDGKVTGVRAGTTTITATADGKSSSVSITVKQRVKSISLNSSSKTLYTGQSLQLKTTVSPENATDKSVKWTSSNPSVATVSSTGKVVAKSRGNAVITAKAKDGSEKTAKCTITVKQKVTKIKLSKTTIKLKKKGAKENLRATALPNNANTKSLTVKIKSKKIASVNKTKINSGASVTIKGKKKGTTKVIFTATDGSKKSAACTVKVLK